MRQEAVTVIRLDTNQVPGEARKVEAAFTGMAGTANRSAGQIKSAMQSLPAQFTDVATQLAGGQNPLLILLQQGGQVRDQFGGIGAALRGIGSLISPATLGVAGVAALAGVLLAAERDATKFRNAIELSGNAAGLTEDRYNQLARAVVDSSQATVSGAKDIALALVQAGTVGGGALESVALAAARVADVSGRSGDEVAKDFARMGAGVADWAAEHNKAWNFITAEQYKYIKQLEDQGKAEEAMIFVSKQLTSQLESQRSNLGTLESAWLSLAKTASEAWQAMLGVGKADTTQEQLAKVTRQIQSFETNLPGANVDGDRRVQIEQQLARLREDQLRLIRQADREQTNALALSDSKSVERAKIAALRDAEKKRGRKGPGDGLKNYNPGGLLVGPIPGEGFFPIVDQQGDFRRSELAGTDQVNQALREAGADRLKQQQTLLLSLTDANEKANLDLIADDQQRALAQVDLERQRIQRQIDAIYGSGAEKAAAEQAANEQAAAARQAVGMRFAKDTALVTREETRNALAEAFQDTKDPIRAFGDALGNIVFQRVSSRLADALLTAAIGPGPDGINGGFLGSLFSAGTSLLSGGVGDYNTLAALSGARAMGGPVDAGGAYLVGERGPEILQMGSQPGRIIPNGRAGGGGVAITLAPIIQIDARADAAQVAQLVAAGMQQTQRDMWAQLHARGLA
jgi:phage-related minor tail protein